MATVVGPAPYIYIDMDETDSSSNVLTVKVNNVTKFTLSQLGNIEHVGAISQSDPDAME